MNTLDLIGPEMPSAVFLFWQVTIATLFYITLVAVRAQS